MSIIYDSLKKVEGKVDSGASPSAPAAQPRPEHTRKPSVTFYVFSGIAACLGIVAASFFFRFFNHATPSLRQASARAKATQPGIKPKAAKALQPSTLPHAPQVSSQEEETPEEQPGEQAPSFVLNGVFSSREGDYALINNQIIKVGDTISGAKLLRVTSDGAELELNGRPVTLSTRRK